MPHYKAVLFDLDGTLLDTLDDLADSMNAVLSSMGFPVWPVDAYKIFVGDGVRNLAIRALPPERRADDWIDRCVAGMKSEYGRRMNRRTRPYDGIPHMLDTLSRRGVPFSILSNKPHEATVSLASAIFGRWRFAAVLGEREGVPRKPDPAAALEIAGRTGVAPAEYLYCGDTATDMRTALNAGMAPLGVLWGFRDRRELAGAGARYIVRTQADITDLFPHDYRATATCATPG